MQINQGYRPALISLAINCILTLVVVNTIGVIASGIYLGLAKDKGPKTYSFFFIVSLVFFLILGLIKNSNSYNDPFKSIFVLVFSNLLLAAIPLVIASITSKISHR